MNSILDINDIQKELHLCASDVGHFLSQVTSFDTVYSIHREEEVNPLGFFMCQQEGQAYKKLEYLKTYPHLLGVMKEAFYNAPNPEVLRMIIVDFVKNDQWNDVFARGVDDGFAQMGLNLPDEQNENEIMYYDDSNDREHYEKIYFLEAVEQLNKLLVTPYEDRCSEEDEAVQERWRNLYQFFDNTERLKPAVDAVVFDTIKTHLQELVNLGERCLSGMDPNASVIDTSHFDKHLKKQQQNKNTSHKDHQKEEEVDEDMYLVSDWEQDENTNPTAIKRRRF